MKGRSGMKPREALAASGACARSWPLMVIRPLVGLSRPAMMRMVVVLPAPFGPRKPWISPGATERLTPSTAVKDPYLLTRVSTAIMASGRLRPAMGLAVALGQGKLEGPDVLGRPPDQEGRVALLDRHLEDAHLGVADGGQDGSLAVQASAGETDVRGVRGELVEGRIDGHPEAAAACFLEVDLRPGVVVEPAADIDEPDCDPRGDAQRAGHGHVERGVLVAVADARPQHLERR